MLHGRSRLLLTNVCTHDISRVIIMLIDIVYSVLAVYKAAIIWKETTGLTGAKLAFNLIRDQAIYFFVCVDTFSHSN